MPRRRSTYRPLDVKERQIRLLRLQASPHEEDFVRCHTQTVSLDDASLYYEALSYVWGDPMVRRTIYLDEEEHDITSNLYEAMVNCRNATNDRVLWIDALSINQDDLNERSRQVPLMYDIYARASMVIIYLGSWHTGVDLAWKFFELVGKDINNHVDPSIEPNALKDELDVVKLDAAAAVMGVVSSPWFTRIWTAQEWHVAQRSKIQCGRKTIDADLVFLAAFYFCGHASTCCSSVRMFQAGGPLYECLTSLATMFVRRNAMFNLAVDGDEDFLSLVATFRTRSASDPRDKIYGLLAIAHNMERHIEKVDYDQTPEEVYIQWTFKTIQETGSLDIFGFLIPETGSLALPSWVPDWTLPLDTELAAQMESRRRLTLPHMYNACAGQPLQCMYNDGRLRIKGRIVDTVAITMREGVSRLSHLRYRFHAASEITALWSRYVEPYLHDDIEALKRQSAFWMTICGGAEVDPATMRCSKRSSITDFSIFEKWKAWSLAPDSHAIPSNDLNPLMAAVGTTCAGRTLAMLENGSLGWVPIGSTAGDVVAVLYGGRMPIVLRSNAIGYTVLGDAYIHGVMDGEALADGSELEDIVLV